MHKKDRNSWEDCQLETAAAQISLCRWRFVWLMGVIMLTLCGSGAAASFSATHVDNFTGHPRVIVISDIGNEPDDQMSLVRLLLYSNQFDIEGLIAATSTWQKSLVHPETMHKLIRTYGLVRPNLLLHAQGWPRAEDLANIVFTGQPGYGLAATGTDKMSKGAEAIIQAVDRNDGRPLWICIWGGANTLAQALLHVRETRPASEVERFVEKLRVYSISDQDDSGPWIRAGFPSLFYIVQPSDQSGSEYYYATWTGISGDVYYRNGAGANSAVDRGGAHEPGSADRPPLWTAAWNSGFESRACVRQLLDHQPLAINH